MRICTDGFISLDDKRRVRTPGWHGDVTEPMPEPEAVSFLLSHAFPGARRIVRPLNQTERRQIRRAVWEESVNDRMALLDPVWRAITEPLPPDEKRHGAAHLVQVACYGERRAYPIYVVDGTTRVRPCGGLPVEELNGQRKAERIELKSAG